MTSSKKVSSDDTTAFNSLISTVDTVIFTVFDKQLHVLTIKRQAPPFAGCWALVGGFVDKYNDEDLQATARRKLAEKTGVETPYLEQFGSIGNATRDPRGWSVTTVYFALISANEVVLQAGKGASAIQWAAIEDNGIADTLAFDHADILAQCLERLRSKVLYTTLPVHLMPDDFTLRELQTVYEIILNKKIEPKSFRRRLLGADILQETGEIKSERGRPSMHYRLKNKDVHFFLRNLESGART